MESTAHDSQYQRLKELIYDEDKIVTTTSLAKELEVPKSDAQYLLDAFVRDTNKTNSEDLYLTFLICGKLLNNKGVGIYLAEQNKLNDKRSLFDNISGEIVYSVQKGQHIDLNVIASTNSVSENGSGPPLISKNCIKRTVRSRKLPPVQATDTAKNAAICIKNSKDTSTGKSQNTLQQNGKDCSQSSQKQNKPKQGGIVSFFAKAASKPLQNSVTLTNENKTSLKQKIEVFAEHTAKDNNQENNENKQITTEKKMDIENQDKDTKVINDQSTSKKRKKDNKNKGPNKKRKRIQEVCDSDSSDIFDNDENEDIIEMSEDEPAPTPIPIPVAVPKNKRRKAVDKTYVDDEGFYVTTTEYIYETAPEDEEKDFSRQKPVDIIQSQKKTENTALETKPTGHKGKVAKKQTNVKQRTLMSFFKKN
ncbi:hypothetical protein Zmor_006210 [Zophobas morio]|uniref:DNA polymerase delta subunit 3 n=1 Tax=Zophobas morio TaxID=2755281 RepID=A0AA38IPM5_9CUCU|nr:hypothetical protein Zmor_006210 [Zophobas morio]